MINNNYVIIVLLSLGLGILQLEGMKREGTELSKQSKRVKRSSDLSFYNPIKICSFKNFEICVSKGADINQKYKKESFFFHILEAIDYRRDVCLRALDNAANDDQQPDLSKLNTQIEELYKCLKLIVTHKDFNVKGHNRYGYSVAPFLIKRNFDPIYSEKSERILPRINEQFLLDVLLQKGLPVNKLYKGKTLLHLVAEQDPNNRNLLSSCHNLETAETLIQYGADINSLTKKGNTALHICPNDVRLVRLLVAHGAQIDRQNAVGQTPADIVENPHTLILINKSEAAEQCKKDVEDRVLIRVATSLTPQKLPHNIPSRLLARATGTFQLKPEICPYTQSIMDITEDITFEQIMTDMGYELRANDSDEESNYFSDDESSAEII